MAMGSRSRREIENAIGRCRPFKNSTGHMTGTRGSTRTLGWLESHTDARRIRELLSRAVYVVWSYGTPIGFVTEDEDGNRTAYYVDEQHSRTTSHHQNIAQMGLGEYETIGTRRPVRRPRRSTDAARQAMTIAQSNENLNAWAEAARREPTAAHAYAGAARRRAMEVGAERAAMRYRTVVNGPEGVEYLDDSIPADSPGYQNGRTESEQEATLARLLDPRYSNPDWVPGRDITADREAERRDIERVEREGVWRP